MGNRQSRPEQSPEGDAQESNEVSHRAARCLQEPISPARKSGMEYVAMYELNRLERSASDNYCMKGNWHTLHGIVDLENEVCLGDRLEFSRNHYANYKHWAIYVGRNKVNKNYDHQVVHFGIFHKGAKFSKKKISGSGCFAIRKPKIMLNSVEEVLGRDMVRINNARDRSWHPLESDYIIKEAINQLENQTTDPPVYHLFRNNCEHFVNHCRYGKSHSDQVQERHIIRSFLGLAKALSS